MLGRGARLSLGHRQQSACQQLRSTSSTVIISLLSEHFNLYAAEMMLSPWSCQSLSQAARQPPCLVSEEEGKDEKGNMGMINCPELSFKS